MVRNQTITAVPRGRSAAAVVAVAAALALLMSFVAPVPTAHAFTDESARGIDVSRWQHPAPESIDWEKVAANGESFAIIKATDPVDGPNANFENDSAEAHANGLILGAYHKAHPDLDATEQADDFVEALELQPEGAVTLPPVLDLELANGLEPDELIEWTEEFMDRVEEQSGRQPMMYTYRSFWRVEMGDTDKFSEYPLWLAAYQDEPPTDDIPGGWDQMTIWQRSSTGDIDGLITPVDLNLFNGTEDDLRAFAEGEKNPDELTDTFTPLADAGSDKSYDQPVSADAINQLIAMLTAMAEEGVEDDQFTSILDVLFSLIESASASDGGAGSAPIPEELETTEPASEPSESSETTTEETAEATESSPETSGSAEPTESESTQTESSEATEEETSTTETTESTEPTETDSTESEPTETGSTEPAEEETSTTESTEDEAVEINPEELTDEQIEEISEATNLTEEQIMEFLSEFRLDNLLGMLRGMAGATESGDLQFTLSDLIDVLNSSLR